MEPMFPVQTSPTRSTWIKQTGMPNTSSSGILSIFLPSYEFMYIKQMSKISLPSCFPFLFLVYSPLVINRLYRLDDHKKNLKQLLLPSCIFLSLSNLKWINFQIYNAWMLWTCMHLKISFEVHMTAQHLDITFFDLQVLKLICNPL